MKCPFCENSVVMKFEDTAFMKCMGCGLFINRPMTSEQVKETNKNFLLGACKDVTKRNARIKEADELQCATLEKYISPGIVYDIGCASGFFMKAARDRGWEVYGNEISVRGIEWAKKNYNIDIDYGFVEEILHIESHHDAVVLWNTLEHTHNPYITLKTCYKMLRRGGLIYIKVPNNKTGWELKRHYEGVHLFEFTDECLSMHLENMGFEEVEINRRDVCPNYGVVAAVYLYRKV